MHIVVIEALGDERDGERGSDDVARNSFSGSDGDISNHMQSEFFFSLLFGCTRKRP